MRAASLADAEEPTEALQEFTEAIRLEPDNLLRYTSRAECYIRVKKYDLAMADIDEALRLNSTYDEAFAERARIHSEKQEYDDAISDYTKAIDLNPSNADSFSGRATVFEKKRDYESAILDLDKAILLNPAQGLYRSNRAMVFQKMGKVHEQLQDLLKARQTAPKWPGVNNDLAWLLVTSPLDEIRDNVAACDYIADALQLDPNNGNYWDTCAAVFAEIGNFDEAIEWEQAFLERKDVPDDQCHRAEKRLALYRQHEPYREAPAQPPNQFTASTTPTQPGK